MIEPRLVPGVVHLRSQVAAAVTLDRLEALVRARGLTVFARIEFSRDAEAVGLTLSPMAQLVFGNSRAGTPHPGCQPRHRPRVAAAGARVGGRPGPQLVELRSAGVPGGALRRAGRARGQHRGDPGTL